MAKAAVIEFGDGPARKRIVEALHESLLVEAAAGTGKTSELVRRIVAVLARGLTTVDRIVAVTFTRKAAGELKLRLRQELDLARRQAAKPEQTRNLENALEHLEEARIGTIHSFCAEILRERPVEARIDPCFEELNEYEAPRLYARAFRDWIEQKLNESSPGLQRCLIRLAGSDGWDDRTPMERLQAAGWDLLEWRDFPTPWRQEPFDRDPEIDALIEQVRTLADRSALCPNPRDPLREALEPAREVATRIERAETRVYDKLEGLLIDLLNKLKRKKKKGGGFFADGVPRKDVIGLRDGVVAALEDFRQRSEADLAASLQQEMGELLRRYEESKRRAGRLDFHDLLVRTRNLIRDNREVRRQLQQQFTHIFVDELQDTDPLQMEILLLLAADDPEQTDWLKVRPARGKFFGVGDPKQSIYRFRRADVTLYQALRQELQARETGLARLQKSYRAVRPIQEFINAAFEPEMRAGAGGGDQPEYVPLQEYRAANPRQPCVVALPAPRPYGGEFVTDRAVEACLPDAIAAFAGWLIRDSGWTILDPEQGGGEVAIEPRHIAILFRRFVSWGTDVTRDYLRALEAREIPHLLLGSKSFHHREEVETLRAALTAVEWPDDELSVFAALKGPLFAVPDDLLLEYRHTVGRLHPFRRMTPHGDFHAVTEALELLADLHRRRNRRPAVDSVQALLEATRAHAAFAFRPNGGQVLANAYRVCDLARSFELAGGISFRGFVEELTTQAEKNESAEAPALEEAAEGVRLMTVHGAKGLEFPVVILADPTANLARQRAERYVDAPRGICAMRLLGCAPWELLEHEHEESDRDRAEGVRVAYVAATRARDLLVVPAVGDKALDGWLAPLNKALYPPTGGWRAAATAAGCPPFGDATVLARPMRHDAAGEFSVKPGRHDFAGGDYSVVWWDPRQLNLDVEASFGLRFRELLEGDPGSNTAREGVEAYERWKTHRAQALQSGARAQFDVLRAGEAGEPPAGIETRIEVEILPKGVERPTGPRFGTLVHTVLRDVSLDDGQGATESLAHTHARLLGSPQEEIEAAVNAVTAALGHPILRQAATARRRLREWPMVERTDDGRLIEGVIDLAFLDDSGWTIVDFKTDAERTERRQQYGWQLGWYVHGFSRITGLPARGVLLGV